LPNYADGYSDGFSVHTVEAITVVDLDEPQLRNMEHMFHLYTEAVDNAVDVRTVSRARFLINSPDLSLASVAAQDAADGLLSLHQRVVQLQQSASAMCDPALVRVRAAVEQTELRSNFDGYQLRMFQAAGVGANGFGANGAAGGGSPGQGTPSNNGAGFGNLGFGSSRPRVDIPKTLPPEAYTGEIKDGLKQDAKNFMADVKSYIEDSPAHQSDAQKIRFAINYFRGNFANEWKARLARGDVTPGFDSTDHARMDFALFARNGS
jgi:hypothetical protein